MPRRRGRGLTVAQGIALTLASLALVFTAVAFRDLVVEELKNEPMTDEKKGDPPRRNVVVAEGDGCWTVETRSTHEKRRVEFIFPKGCKLQLK